jgi:phosphoglycerate dehydrogenase-like enzyme
MSDNAINVLITFALEPDLVKEIEAVDPRINVTALGQGARQLFRGQRKYPSELEAQTARQEFDEAMSEAEVLFGFWGPGLIELYPSADALTDKAPNLRWLQLTSAGMDRAAKSGLIQSDIMVTSASGLHATPIGEYVLALMLMFCKQGQTFVRAQDRKEWVRFMPQELYGMTIGIVGMGHIGAEVARLSKAFGCRIVAIRRSIAERTEDELGEMLPPADLPYLLEQSDFVVLAMPLTEETRHMIGEAEFTSMKPGARLINIARGPVVDQEALIAALKSGEIAGAGLDVFDPEPLPEDSELWNMENVIMSPHISGGTEIYNQRATGIFADNLKRYIAGERLNNLADPARGY